jgi:cobalt-zinc-cadmium efflux system protein
MDVQSRATSNRRQRNTRYNELSNLKISLSLTAFFMLVEFAGGWWTNSLALMADAGHMLTDVGALGLSLFALWFSSRPATSSKTYGFFRVEILAALFNGATLIALSLMIFYQAALRLWNPPRVNSKGMLLIALIGLLVNVVSAWFLHRSHSHSLNLKGAFLHVIGDAVSSVGTIAAGFLMLFRGWYLADPVISLLVGLLILYSSWALLKDSVDILLEGAPAHIDLTIVKNALSSVEGIESIHDLHIWTLTSGIHAMSCHAVVCGTKDRHEILEGLNALLRRQFALEHTTIQIEEINLQHKEMRSCHEH